MTNEQPLPHGMRDWNDASRGILYRSRTTHLALVGVMVLVGVVGAFFVSPADWHPLRIAAAGLLAGVGAYLSLFVNWILVADW